jgi:hypothetical protein
MVSVPDENGQNVRLVIGPAVTTAGTKVTPVPLAASMTFVEQPGMESRE